MSDYLDFFEKIMPGTHKYEGIYECKLCGKQYVVWGCSNTSAKDSYFRARGHINDAEIHECDDGSFGLSHFIGIKRNPGYWPDSGSEVK